MDEVKKTVKAVVEHMTTSMDISYSHEEEDLDILDIAEEYEELRGLVGMTDAQVQQVVTDPEFQRAIAEIVVTIQLRATQVLERAREAEGELDGDEDEKEEDGIL